MKSFSPRDSFALFDEEDIGTLFGQYADEFSPGDRDRVIDEAKKLVSELRPIVHKRRVEAAFLAGAKAGEISAAATERHTKEMLCNNVLGESCNMFPSGRRRTSPFRCLCSIAS